MPIEIKMPALSPTMTEGNLAKWMVKEGDTVESGDVIAEIETDKATMEVEAVDEGTIGKILIEEGTENVAVNTPIAVLLEEGEDASAAENMSTSAPASTNDEAPQEQAASAEDTQSDDDDATPSYTPAAGSEGKVIENRDILYAQGAVLEPQPFDEASFMETTKNLQVREALRDAMAEEMRADDKVFVMGEEVAEYQLSLIHI